MKLEIFYLKIDLQDLYQEYNIPDVLILFFVGMFKFWKSGAKAHVAEVTEDRSWQFLGSDMHAHILPGLDDGAQNLDQSMEIIETMQRLGFRKMVTTPHINEDIYRNTPEIIMKALALVKQEVAARGWTIAIEAGAEYMIDAGFMSLLNNNEESLLTIYDNKVLVEMSYIQESRYLLDALFLMQAKGYKPILAHPERYIYYHNRLDMYKELKERGCYFQLNTIALSGYYGKDVKRAAEQLLEAGLYDYCGSDAHHMRHTEAMQRVLHSSQFLQLIDYAFLNKEINIKDTNKT